MKKKFGLNFTREHLMKYYGMSTRRIAKKFFELEGASVSDEQLEEYVKSRRGKVIELIEESGVSPMPGALRLLAEMKLRKLKIGLATSNTRETANAILEAAKIGEYFNAVVTREDVERGKPEPDIFLEAANRLEVAPNDCVVVEDSVYGVTAARKAGMKVVGVSTGFHRDDELKPNSILVVHALSELSVARLSDLFAEPH
jgi:HAD superfamily hydrolase (TIGR01509 family)